VKALTKLQVDSLLKRPGFHRVSQSLYLNVTENGRGSFVYRYWDGRLKKNRDLGLGSYGVVTLAEARNSVIDYNRLRHRGVDPISHKRKTRTENQLKSVTFDHCAKQYLADHSAKWKNEKHRQQWKNTLETYASPHIGPLPVGAVDTHHVIDLLKPIWKSRTETASRVRGRIEKVLDWATVKTGPPSKNIDQGKILPDGEDISN